MGQGKQSTLELVDRILDGKLRETLVALRESGETYDQMAVHFDKELRLTVTRETLRRWVKQLGIEEPAA